MSAVDHRPGVAPPTLDRDAFLGKQATLAVEPVLVPALGGQVFVRVFSGAARDAWEIASAEQKKSGEWNLRALMVALGACTEDGIPLFTLADVPRLGRLDWRQLEAVAARVDALNGLSGVSREDLAKNSPSGPTSVSGSGSQAT